MTLASSSSSFVSSTSSSVPSSSPSPACNSPEFASLDRPLAPPSPSFPSSSHNRSATVAYPFSPVPQLSTSALSGSNFASDDVPLTADSASSSFVSTSASVSPSMHSPVSSILLGDGEDCPHSSSSLISNSSSSLPPLPTLPSSACISARDSTTSSDSGSFVELISQSASSFFSPVTTLSTPSSSSISASALTSSSVSSSSSSSASSVLTEADVHQAYDLLDQLAVLLKAQDASSPAVTKLRPLLLRAFSAVMLLAGPLMSPLASRFVTSTAIHVADPLVLADLVRALSPVSSSAESVVKQLLPAMVRTLQDANTSQPVRGLIVQSIGRMAVSCRSLPWFPAVSQGALKAVLAVLLGQDLWKLGQEAVVAVGQLIRYQPAVDVASIPQAVSALLRMCREELPGEDEPAPVNEGEEDEEEEIDVVSRLVLTAVEVTGELLASSSITVTEEDAGTMCSFLTTQLPHPLFFDDDEPTRAAQMALLTLLALPRSSRRLPAASALLSCMATVPLLEDHADRNLTKLLQKQLEEGAGAGAASGAGAETGAEETESEGPKSWQECWQKAQPDLKRRAAAYSFWPLLEQLIKGERK
eukprot:GILI01001752.1.p1 GENE.GILI01001752.1~~GILI01001752.1.p1  ORF type:complete len:663 (+),score=155.78 GILI01001752.1:226-1989(+)